MTAPSLAAVLHAPRAVFLIGVGYSSAVNIRHTFHPPVTPILAIKIINVNVHPVLWKALMIQKMPGMKRAMDIRGFLPQMSISKGKRKAAGISTRAMRMKLR